MNAKQKLLARLGPKQKPVAYERKTVDLVGEDSIENFMPAPKRLVTEEYEEIAAELHKKTLEIQYTENFIKEAIEASLRLTEAVYKTAEENSIKEATINELSGKLKNLEEDAKNKLSEIQGLTDQLNKLEAYKTTAQAENTELNNQIVELQDDIKTKTNEFNELNQNYQTALDQINQLKQNIIQNNATIEENKKQLITANEEITGAKNNLVKLQEELKQITGAYWELKANYDQSIKDYDMVSGSLVAVRGEKETLQKNLQAEQAKNADLEAKYNTTSEDRDRLRRDYDFVYGKNEKNEEENARLLEQYDAATRKINVLRAGSDIQQQRIVALEDNVKGLEANAKTQEKLVSDLRKQAKESESLRNQLVQVTTDLNNTKASFGPAVGAAVEQENRRLQRLHEKEINKLNEDLQGSKKRNKILGEKLKTADTDKQVALAQQEREFLSKFNAQNDENFAKVEALNRQHAAKLADLQKTLFEQEGLRKAAVEDKIALEKEIKTQINEKEKLIDRLKQKKDELKDAQAALKNLKDKFGEQDLLKKQIANFDFIF